MKLKLKTVFDGGAYFMQIFIKRHERFILCKNYTFIIGSVNGVINRNIITELHV